MKAYKGNGKEKYEIILISTIYIYILIWRLIRPFVSIFLYEITSILKGKFLQKGFSRQSGAFSTVI